MENNFCFSSNEQSLHHKLIKLVRIFITIDVLKRKVAIKGKLENIPEVSESSIGLSFC